MRSLAAILFAPALLVVALASLGCDTISGGTAASTGPALTGAAAGESLFYDKCAICHLLGSDRKVGPALKGSTDRHTDQWLTEWLANPQGTWDGNHPETVEMKKRLSKSNAPLTAMKNRELTPEQIAQLISFLKRNDGKVEPTAEPTVEPTVEPAQVVATPEAVEAK